MVETHSERFEDHVMARVPVLVAVVLMVATLVVKDQQTHHLARIVTQPLWIINFCIVLAFSFYVYRVAAPSETTTALRSATSKGIVALVIALLAEAGLAVGPFWVVFSLAYFMDDWGE